jgi:DNA mismatch repair protein MutS2
VQKEVERRSVELKAAVTTAARNLKVEQSAATEKSSDTSVAAELETLDFQAGDRVKVLSLDQVGIVESVNADIVSVQVGALRFREQRENLRLIERKQQSKAAKASFTGLPKGVSVSLNEQRADVRSELNVIGKTVNEATDETDKFLDAAYLSNHERVRIVHGTGMGILKRAIADLLADHPHVAKFHPAPPAEGGNGATVVELKK